MKWYGDEIVRIEQKLNKALEGEEITRSTLWLCFSIIIHKTDKDKFSNWDIIKMIVDILKWQDR